jgi:hypothetical protein
MMTQQTTTPRALRGYIIANTNLQVEKNGEDVYTVKSQSSERTYTVTKVLGNWKCECADHTFRNVKCKHIHAVEFFNDMENSKTAKKKASSKCIN